MLEELSVLADKGCANVCLRINVIKLSLKNQLRTFTKTFQTSSYLTQTKGKGRRIHMYYTRMHVCNSIESEHNMKSVSLLGVHWTLELLISKVCDHTSFTCTCMQTSVYCIFYRRLGSISYSLLLQVCAISIYLLLLQFVYWYQKWLQVQTMQEFLTPVPCKSKVFLHIFVELTFWEKLSDKL